METNKIIREQIFEIIKNQIKSNNPPETKDTLDRLKKIGYSDEDTTKLIGQCVAIELFNVLKHNQPFDELRYISNLKKLPKEPFDSNLDD
jgi:predicted house-cleaning noncanonical NTP pyrophosphatase (MazG superfamily)